MLFLLFFLAVFSTSVELGGHLLEVEVVQTEEEKKRGLMGRTSLAKDAGMLFVYDKPQILSFWMKDTLIPLSIGFFDQKKKLINVREMRVACKGEKDFPLYESLAPAMYALEVPASWFTDHKIKSGMVLKIHSP